MTDKNPIPFIVLQKARHNSITNEMPLLKITQYPAIIKPGHNRAFPVGHNTTPSTRILRPE